MVTWRADRHGNVLEMEGWNEFTGQSTQAALGRGWVERVHPEDLPDLIQTLETAARAGIATATAEVRVRTEKYDWVWVNFRGAMITDAEGIPAEWIGTLENIDDRKRLQLRISHMAYHDALTGLPNRIRLAEHFEELWLPSNSGQSCALLATGDALLREVAIRLQKVLRHNDLAARLGGDEFAVVLVALENFDYSTTIASRIVKALSVPFEIDGHSVQIGASVGVAPFLAGGVSIERLQFEADTALYRAKSEGRNRWSFTANNQDGQQRALKVLS
jgi:PAS domain S-box-containing protein